MLRSINVLKRLDTLVFTLCLLVLIFNQLAFGGVHIWAATLSQVLIFGLTWLTILLLVFKVFGPRDQEVLPASFLAHPVLPFILLGLLLTGCQILPLPQGLVKVISPEAWQMHHQLVQAKVVDSLGKIRLSLEPFSSLSLGIEHLSQALFLVLLLIGLKNRPRVLILVSVLLGLALFQLCYGLTQTFSANPKIWWWEKDFGADWLTGTYLNRNHLAGFFELSIPLAFGLGLAFWPRDLDKLARRYAPGSSALKKKSLFFEQRIRSLLFFSLGVFLGIGLLLTGSRGGVICLAAGTFIISFLFMFKRSLRGFGLWLGVFLLIIAVYGLQVGIEKTAERFEQTEGLVNRLERTESILPMMADYPLTGVGLGNFDRVYPEYQRPGWSGRRHCRYAHNDWVQAGAEFGYPGLLLALAGYLTFLVYSVRRWFNTRDQFAVGLGGGLLIGYLALGIHSFFDFNLHIPANILSFVACLALMQAVLKPRPDNNWLSYISSKGWPTKTGILTLLGVISFGLLFCLNFVLNQHQAEAFCPTLKNSTIDRKLEPSLTGIRRAIELCPGNPAYWNQAGRKYLKKASSNANGSWPEIMLTRAQERFEKGLTLSPANAYLWLALGQTRAILKVLNKQESDYKIMSCLNNALRLRPKDQRFVSRVAAWKGWLVEEAEGGRQCVSGQ